MSYGIAIFLVLAFVTGVLLLEGVYLLWNEHRGPEARRLQQRLQNLSAGGLSGQEARNLLKRGSSEQLTTLDKLILAIPRVRGLDRFIEQSGMSFSIGTFLLVSIVVGLVSFVGGVVIARFPPLFAAAIAVLCALIPYAWLSSKRRKRLTTIERELPEAIDLISRAMQAGHGFSSAMQMVGDELSGPISEEFKILSDELAFGIPTENAFGNFATRVPSDDVRFFVIAVLLQRETGGNLVEVLQNISRLVRDRLALYGKVRVLAAEGKMSVWVLTGMPIATAAAIQAVNPQFLSVLFTDPTGLKMVYCAILMIILGVIWMLNIVKIKV
jgi:tight adherence protein B